MLTIGTNGNATCTVNKKYLRFIGYNLLLVSLGLISLVTSLSTESWVAYALFVGGILFCLSLSMRNQQLFEFSIFTLLTYVFTLEVVVHYLGHPINIRLRDLSLIPISLLLLRYSTKIFKSFSWWACTLGLFFYTCLGVIIHSTPGIQALESAIPYIIGIEYFFAIRYSKSDLSFVDLYKFIYVICFFFTIGQTIAGFNVDQRNGIFGVFGLGAYSAFVLLYPIYEYSKWSVNQGTLRSTLISIVISVAILIMTESKAQVVLLFIALLIIGLIQRKVNLRPVIGIVLVSFLVCVAVNLLIEIYPRFKSAMTLNGAQGYIFGNSNWGIYQYGRFEALINVYSRQSTTLLKIIGNGLGSAASLDIAFLKEAGKVAYQPYFVRLYGLYYGYDLTGLSKLFLDGGIVLPICFLSVYVRTLLADIKSLRSTDKNVFVKAAVCLSFLINASYAFTYADGINDREMAFAAIICALVIKQVDQLNRDD